jgi:divalent metal cation (Fe/Co/Zn/Cd) transporter
MGVCFVAGTTAEEMHEAIHRIEADLRSTYPETNRVYIEAESLPAESGEECRKERQLEGPEQQASQK